MQAYASYLVKVCMNKYAYKTMAYMYTDLQIQTWKNSQNWYISRITNI